MKDKNVKTLFDINDDDFLFQGLDDVENTFEEDKNLNLSFDQKIIDNDIVDKSKSDIISDYDEDVNMFIEKESKSLENGVEKNNIQDIIKEDESDLQNTKNYSKKDDSLYFSSLLKNDDSNENLDLTKKFSKENLMDTIENEELDSNESEQKNEKIEVKEDYSEDEDTENIEDITGDKEEEQEIKKRKKTNFFIIKGLKFILFLFLILTLSSFFAVAYGTLVRTVKYSDTITKYSKKYNVDPVIITAIIKTESNFNPKAVSNKNAMGLMQILPDTGKWICEKMNIEFKEEMLFNPDYNIKLGTYYIKYLMDVFENDNLAYAAYNGGITNVKTWLKEGVITREKETLKNIPFTETRNYVVKINDYIDKYKAFYSDGLPSEAEFNNKFKLIFKNYKSFIKKLFSEF